MGNKPLFLLIPLAAFFLYSGSPAVVDFKNLPPSAADADCKSKWVDEARNDPALACYLTTKTKRLCDPAEREHLAKFISAYEAQRKVFDAKVMSYVVSQATRQPPPTNLRTPNMKKAITLQLMVDNQIRDLIVPLAQQGLVAAKDFQWGYPGYVKDAFDNVLGEDLRSTCPAQQG
jgi:hypothetical protein